MRTGETFICSIVPFSFSVTMLMVGKKPPTRIITTIIRAGTMNSLYSRCGLNLYWGVIRSGTKD